jgi:hypothetical protein
MATKPFNDTEIIEGLRIKLAEMRTEARASEERLRAEFKAEIAKLRAEIGTEHGKRRSSLLPLRDPVGVNRAH